MAGALAKLVEESVVSECGWYASQAGSIKTVHHLRVTMRVPMQMLAHSILMCFEATCSESTNTPTYLFAYE